jgi:N utilization substance protein B
MPARLRSRQRALQILFLWEFRKQPVQEAIASYYELVHADEERKSAPDEFLERLVTGTIEHMEAIDSAIAKHAEHWRVDRMAAVDRNLLRLAVFEIRYTDTPPAVVIDEALELARRYSTEESVQFVNGVLDAVHRESAVTHQRAGDPS